jgi:hypothetical protein
MNHAPPGKMRTKGDGAMKWHVEHNRGTAGIDEHAVEEFNDIDALNPLQAIKYVTNLPEGWIALLQENALGLTATVSNPDVANASGQFCDYWFAYPQSEHGES